MSDLKKLRKHEADLAAKIVNLGQDIDVLKKEKRQVASEHSRVRTELRVEEKLSKMNDDERAALAQALKAKGIVSKEKAGTPGA